VVGMWWFIVDVETNAMHNMRHSSMVYSTLCLVGSVTLLLGFVRHGGWRWRAGSPMWFIVEVVDSKTTTERRRITAVTVKRVHFPATGHHKYPPHFMSKNRCNLEIETMVWDDFRSILLFLFLNPI
jgi:hypothetical protein